MKNHALLVLAVATLAFLEPTPCDAGAASDWVPTPPHKRAGREKKIGQVTEAGNSFRVARTYCRNTVNEVGACSARVEGTEYRLGMRYAGTCATPPKTKFLATLSLDYTWRLDLRPEDDGLYMAHGRTQNSFRLLATTAEIKETRVVDVNKIAHEEGFPYTDGTPWKKHPVQKLVFTNETIDGQLQATVHATTYLSSLSRAMEVFGFALARNGIRIFDPNTDFTLVVAP